MDEFPIDRIEISMPYQNAGFDAVDNNVVRRKCSFTQPATCGDLAWPKVSPDITLFSKDDLPVIHRGDTGQ
jgi:hypothetical protein